MKYAVVVYMSFDEDTPIYLFDNEESAKEYVHKLYEYEVYESESIATIDDNNTFNDGNYAKIVWINGDYIEVIVTDVREPFKF